MVRCKKILLFTFCFQGKTITSVVHVPLLKKQSEWNKCDSRITGNGKNICGNTKGLFFFNRFVYRPFCLMCSILIIPSQFNFYLSEA